MAFYKKRVVARDTPEDIAWREAQAKARAQLLRERVARYPEINADNFAEVAKWQEARQEELLKSELACQTIDRIQSPPAPRHAETQPDMTRVYAYRCICGAAFAYPEKLHQHIKSAAK